jgi:hypothetical protein
MDDVTPRLALPLLVTAALVAGCGGSSSPVTSSAPAADAAAPSGAASTAPSASARRDGAARPVGAAPSTRPAAAASAAPAGATAGTSTTTASGSSSERATAPGTYTYDTSGTVTAGTPHDASGTATLTVDRPAAGVQHSVLTDGQGKTEQDLVTRPTGTYLARLVLTTPAFTKEFRPAAPVLLVPSPTTVGRAWSWSGTSTDGKTKVAVTSRLARHETLTVGGSRTATDVVISTLKLTGDVTYTGRMETWRDPLHLLVVKDHTTGNGTVSGFAFSTDITSVLRTTKPS